MSGITYKDAGVDIDAGARAVSLMKAAVEATHGPEVLAGVGAFGGLFDLGGVLARESAPVLVSSTDGVGTKTRVAARLGRYEGVGHDIVNHCVNDILVQDARPLFFLDYVASAKLEPEVVATIVGGAAAACRAVGCALLGGETAEMPGVYAPGEFDLVGTIVGVVGRGQILDGRAMEAGDVVLGLGSTGLHTNGYSLARRLLEGLDWEEARSDLGGRSVGDCLLAPHRAYLADVEAMQAAGVALRGLAHITGGGLIDNPPRITPEALSISLTWGSWEEPPIFGLLRRLGQVAPLEMARTFNLGLGMLAVVPAAQAQLALEAAVSPCWRVGEVVPRAGRAAVLFQDKP